MKLTYFQETRNFGDDLNSMMWQHLLPKGFLDDHSSELFLGIGSILWDHFPPNARKIVVGSGYGGYTAPPKVDESWEILFVRGARTADALKVSRKKAITDSAILLRYIPLPDASLGIKTAFMPHFQSIDRGHWEEACRLAGIHLIDPTDPADVVLSQIQGASLLITEAMHGAIVADALRTPWIPLRPIHQQHRMKWYDWTESMELAYEPKTLPPSSVRELWSIMTAGDGQGQWSRLLGGRAAYPANLALNHIAARGLAKLSQQTPNLSDDRIVNRKADQAKTVLDDFIRRRTARA